jgi:prolyl-tRNA synthetase
MYLSQYFLPISKDDPKDAAIISHKLLLKAGMVRQLAAGLYNWLPLGYKVLRRVEQVIREEMNNAGAIEILMPTMQPVDLWKKSGRYGAEGDLSSEMLILTDRNGNELTYAPTAEEVITDLLKNTVQSYKDLPKNLYQISWKFRDEIRPRFGLMRAREFLMKDAYSFDVDETSALISYEKMFIAYLKAFKRMGLRAVPVKADTGSMGGDLSHEFHVLAENGESTIFFEQGLEEYLESMDINLANFNKFYANEKEKHIPENCTVDKSKLFVKKGIEVGHIFYLGDKYSKALGMNLQNGEGKLFNPKMGCYGIGVSRLVAAIIEASHDDKGIIWPESISPFDIAIINLKPGHEQCDDIAFDLYDALRLVGKDVIIDDTSNSAGSKFATMELIGIPWSIIVGPKFASEDKVEVVHRKTGERHELSVEAVKAMFSKD